MFLMFNPQIHVAHRPLHVLWLNWCARLPQMLCCYLLFAASLVVQAQGLQQGKGADLQTTYVAQVGVDAWRLSPQTPERLLFLPTNSQWNYRSTSPWLTFDGQATVHRHAVLSLKVRADQALGTHVDEMSLDWALSPSLGVKTGVVSYKTSWCRTYDVDSPWVRENDPFCTIRTTSVASGGAPGLQVYANAPVGDYRVQGLVGLYRPLLLNYNTTEFSNVDYPNSHIDRNSKKSLSLSVQNMDTATELRLGLLNTVQSNYVYDYLNEGPDRVRQNYNVMFLGAAFYVLPKLQVRVQTLRHDMISNRRSPPGSEKPSYLGGADLARRSHVLEMNYWHSAQDVLAFAVSKYTFDSSYINTNYPDPGYINYRSYYRSGNRNLSASWRHNWSEGFYTAVQWSYNKLDLYILDEQPSPYREAGGHGLGLRLGYQF